MVRKRRESHVCEQCDEHIFHFPHSWKRGWEKSNGRYEIIWNVCEMSREKQQRTKILLFNLPRENITELELWARSDVPFPSTRKKNQQMKKVTHFCRAQQQQQTLAIWYVYMSDWQPPKIWWHIQCVGWNARLCVCTWQQSNGGIRMRRRCRAQQSETREKIITIWDKDCA